MKTPSKEDIQDLKVAAEMQDLLNTPGWKLYEKLLRDRIEAQRKLYEIPVQLHAGVDGVVHVLAGESAKGAIMGLRLALELPSLIVAGAEDIRRTLNPKDAEVSP